MPLSGSDRINPESCPDFDDVMIEPTVSHIAAQDVILHTRFSTNICLHLPFVLLPATTDAAIHAAQLGGIGIIPNDMPVSKQADMVRHVKRFQSRIVRNVISLTPETSIIEALEYKQRYDIDAMPVIEVGTRVLAGFFIYDAGIDYDAEKTVADYMGRDNVLTIDQDTGLDDAWQLMQENKAGFVTIVDPDNRCVGMITLDDKTKAEQFPQATMDENGALRVAAVVGTDHKELDRVDALIDAGVDVIVVMAANGHSKAALEIVTHIRRQRTGHVDVIAGNVATAQAARALIDAGANGLIAGRDDSLHHLGIGLPHFSSLLEAGDAASMHNVPVIAAGLERLDHQVKALAAGASSLALTTLDGHEDLQEQIGCALCHVGCASIADFGTQTRFVRVK